jgi:carbonic anhydrase
MKGKSGDFVDLSVRENARLNAQKVMAESEIVKELAHGGKLKVVYARYDLDTGAVEFLG